MEASPTKPAASPGQMSHFYSGAMSARGLAPRSYERLCRWALVALVGIVVTGGAVRLTGSGLGCTDWPNCTQDRLVPSWEFHGLVEFVNRVITGFVSLAVIAAVGGAWLRRPRRKDLLGLALGLVAGVIGQILLGAMLVLADLDPRLTLGHFLLSMVLVGNAVVLIERAKWPDTARHCAPALPRRQRWLLVSLAAGVLFMGTLVTGSGPHGGDDRAERLGFAVTSVVRIHSGLVWLLVFATVGVALKLHRSPNTPEELRSSSQRLLLVVALQGAVGYYSYFADVPALAVGIHLLGATVVWALVVHLVGLRGHVPVEPSTTGVNPAYAVHGSIDR